MQRELTNSDEGLRWWRYIVRHAGEDFIQVVQGLPDGGPLDTWVGHLSYIPEPDGSLHEVLNVIRWQGSPYYPELAAAIQVGDALIRAWKLGDPQASFPRSTGTA
jgi:hypothetical protein